MDELPWSVRPPRRLLLGKAGQGHRYSYWVLVGNSVHPWRHARQSAIHGATGLISGEYCSNSIASERRRYSFALRTFPAKWCHYGSTEMSKNNNLRLCCYMTFTLTTWFEYSSPSIWPPAIATSFFFPGTNDRFSKPVFDNDERSLTGEKTFKREPYDLRRNVIWLDRT